MNRPVTRARRGLCWGTVPQASAAELVRAAADAGFEAVTLSPLLHDDVLDDGGQAIRNLCAATGVSIEAIDPLIGSLPGLPGADEVGDDLAPFLTTTAARVIPIAEAVGARSVNIAHFLGRPVRLAALIEAIGTVVEQATRRGLAVTVEFIPGTGIPDLATALHIVEAIEDPALGILLDVWHLARSSGTTADVAALPAASIGGMQISDRVAPAPGADYVPMSARLLPGEGELPLDALLMAALTNSPGITVCAEIFNPDGADLPIEVVVRRTAAAMQSLGFR